jgi:hypothetical protein
MYVFTSYYFIFKPEHSTVVWNSITSYDNKKLECIQHTSVDLGEIATNTDKNYTISLIMYAHLSEYNSRTAE